jgi:N-acetylmuramoyl-L-alanine amidase
VVEPGEHLSAIAARFGFRDFRTIFEHPANAELRRKRVNPNVLRPGDVVVIPDLAKKEEPATTGRFNAFVAAGTILGLNVRVERIGGAPLADRETTAAMGERAAPAGVALDPPQKSRTDGKGKVAVVISATTVEGELTLTAKPPLDLADDRFRMIVGGLNPVLDDATGTVPADPATGAPDLSGVRARLNNLGYFAGYTERDDDQLRWAVEEFQCEHRKSHGLKVTGELDRKTLEALRKVHGDTP